MGAELSSQGAADDRKGRFGQVPGADILGETPEGRKKKKGKKKKKKKEKKRKLDVLGWWFCGSNVFSFL
jgi:hypothetical protein